MRPQKLYYPLLAIGLLTIVAYIPAMRGPFVFDDVNVIVNDPAITAFPPVLDWFNPASRPLVGLTFSLNYKLGGADPIGYHLANLFLHLGCGWLVADLARLILARLSREGVDGKQFVPVWDTFGISGCALLFTTFWLLHPLSSSAVAYIVQRSEILAACAIVGFQIAILRDSAAAHRWWQWVALLTFVAGMYCKVNTISALPIALLLDRLLLSDSWWDVFRRRGALYLVPVLLGLAAFLVMLPALRRGEAGVGFAAEEIPTVPIYLATQARVLWHYLSLCVWPSELCIDYRWPPVASLAEAVPWIILSLGLLGSGLLLYWRGRLLGWLVLSVFLLLAPTSTFIPVTDIALDHRMYLATAAVIAIAMSLVHFVICRFRWTPSPWVWGPMAVVILVAMFVRTSMRANDWGSGFDLWRSAVLVVPHNPRALQNLTHSADEEGRRGELLAFLETLRTNLTAQGQVAPAVASRLAEEIMKSGQPADVEPLLVEAISGLRATGPIDERQELAAAHVNLGLLRLQQGQVHSAAEDFAMATVIDSKQAFAHAILGDIALQQHEYGKAVIHFEKALSIRPDWEQVAADLEKAKTGVTKAP
jgi:protein O-mannosyl-transferase